MICAIKDNLILQRAPHVYARCLSLWCLYHIMQWLALYYQHHIWKMHFNRQNHLIYPFVLDGLINGRDWHSFLWVLVASKHQHTAVEYIHTFNVRYVKLHVTLSNAIVISWDHVLYLLVWSFSPIHTHLCKSHDHDHQWANLIMTWLPKTKENVNIKL